MTTSQLPTPTLQPIVLQPVGTDSGDDAKNLLAVVESAGSCCGGSSCAID